MQLRGPLRRIAALLFATGARLFVRWIPSELNSSDNPSRIFSNSKILTEALDHLHFDGKRVANMGVDASVANCSQNGSIGPSDNVAEAATHLDDGGCLASAGSGP